jgi:hypothetical protein
MMFLEEKRVAFQPTPSVPRHAEASTDLVHTVHRQKVVMGRESP